MNDCTNNGMNIWAVLLAAGRSTRLSAAGLPDAKQFLHWRGVPLYWHSACTMARVARLAGLVFVFPPERVAEESARLATLDDGKALGLPWHVAAGGALRQDSVANGLALLPLHCDGVLVHDTARPFATPQLVNRVIDALATGAPGVIPGIAVTDTIKQVAGDLVTATPDRASLVAVQTPQGFLLPHLQNAHARAQAEGWQVTDDAALLERLGVPVTVVAGEAGNIKITNPEDLAMLTDPTPAPVPVVGWGYDVHRYGTGRPMKLGGVPIPGAPEIVAHSDGDVLLHALMDGLLGCIGAGDIGQHFPDTSASYDNANSALLLDHVLTLTRAAGLTITHVDLTIVAQVPRIAPHRDAIHRNIAQLLGLDHASVNLKATTEEKLGFTGEKKGIKAMATVTGLRARQQPAT